MGMKRCLIVGAALATIATGIVAKPAERAGTGTLIPRRETSAPVNSAGYAQFRSITDVAAKAALASASAFAECIVAKRPEVASKVVLENIYDVRKRFPELLDPRCLPDKKGFDFIAKLNFPGDTLHQSLSDALIKIEFAADAPSDFSNVPVVSRVAPTPTPPEKLNLMSAKIRERTIARDAARQTWFLLSQIGECVSRRSPEGVRALALTAVGSPGEQAMAHKLRPDIAACVPAGTTVRMRVGDLRGPTVRNYYHLARCALTGRDSPILANEGA